MDMNKIDVRIISEFQIYQNDIDGNEEYITSCSSLNEVNKQVKSLVNCYYNEAREIDDKMSEQDKMNYAFSQYLARPFIIKEIRTAIPELM